MASSSRPAPNWPGQIVDVGGLTLDQLCAIAGHRLRRALTATERTAVAAAARQARGHPLTFLHLIDPRGDRLCLSSASMGGAAAPESLAGASEPHKLLVALMASVRGAAIPSRLYGALTATEPDLATMEYVTGWFARTMPTLAGAVSGLIANPTVKTVVAAGGEALAAEFRRRFPQA